MMTVWLEHLMELRNLESGENEQMSASIAREETVEFVQFIGQIWPKYMQVGLTEMASELKLRKSAQIDLPNEEFDKLPQSSLNSIDQVRLFADFVASDLEIEIIRYLKL